jgi:hypothetical protein
MTFLGCYFFWRGERLGPVSPAEIARLVGSGVLRPEAPVLQAWLDGGETFFFPVEAGSAHGVEVPLFS